MRQPLTSPPSAPRDPLLLRRFRQLMLALLACYWLMMFTGTHLPSPSVAMHTSDKLLHVLGFAGLGFLLGWWVGGNRPSWRGFLIVLTVAAVYGAVDELSQSLVPGRSCDVMDWLADMTGAVIGLAGYRLSLSLLRSWASYSARRTSTVAT